MKALIILPSTKKLQTKLNNLWDGFDIHIYADNLSLDPIDDNFKIIGDLDSISYNTKQKYKNNIIHITDQKTTDCEKALEYCKSYPSITILGNKSTRSDHFLYNIGILKKFTNNKSINITNEHETMFFINKSTTFNTQKDQKIAIFSPFEKTFHVKTKGLKYNIDEQTMEYGKLDSPCNTAIAKKVNISFTKGSLLIIQTNS